MIVRFPRAWFPWVALLAACGQGSGRLGPSKLDDDTVSESGGPSPTTVTVSRELELCGGTSTQLGWARASESRGVLQVLADGTFLALDGLSGTGRLELAAVYTAPGGGPQDVSLVGDASVVDGHDKEGNPDPNKRRIESRLLMMESGLRVDLFAEIESSGTVFDLSVEERTRWLLCEPAGESCEWRVGMLECESMAATVGLVVADLGASGMMSLEVRRAYSGSDNYSRVTRAWGTLDGIPFDESDGARLLMDTQDVTGAAERFAVLFEEPRGAECGLELALPFDVSGPTAHTIDCEFLPVRSLDVVGLTP